MDNVAIRYSAYDFLFNFNKYYASILSCSVFGLGQLGAANSATGQFGARPTRRGRFGAGTFRRSVSNGDIEIMNEVH